MKKIFLPLVALCGLVAGLTLTSCGGGGGGEGAAGKTYQFKRDFAVMEIAFGNRKGDPQETPEGTEQYYNGFVSYKEESGSNDTSMTEQDEVTITVKQNDEGITIHVNDRRILRAMALSAGFGEEVLEEVFIILDKLDKIGAEGVKAELLTLGLEESAVDAYLALFENCAKTGSEFCAALPEEILSAQVPAGLDTILSCVAKALGENVTLKFDPTLVRGMGYYTGTIFEVKLNEYNFSIAGGGRYDEMIGKFSGQKVPACGFSIGFERIITILKDHPVQTEKAKEGIALLVENGADADTVQEIFARAAALRAEGKTVTVLPLKKNAKFQIDRLMEDGFTKIERIYKK
jgi:histidyl-tRNA synthetase